MLHALLLLALLPVLALGGGRQTDKPFMTSQLIFPLEHWHNHSSMVVELPSGELLVCWFHGSGERTADDVVVRGARLPRGASQWSAPFLMADTPGYPDTNATMFLDPRKRLWLMWPTILANEWHTALMKYKVSSDYAGPGAPRWETSEVLHLTPGDEFAEAVNREADRVLASGTATPAMVAYLDKRKKDAADKLSRRLGWMTRAHPFVLDGTRLIVPLYSDGFDFSLMGISDDWGATWKTSTPLVGAGNIQPTLARRTDGTLVAYMRDNGPAPKRLMTSRSTDRGETWSPVEDTDLPNPGAGAEPGRSPATSNATPTARPPRAGAGSITTRPSSRRPTARCTRPTAISRRRIWSSRMPRDGCRARPSNTPTSTRPGSGPRARSDKMNVTLHFPEAS